MHQNQNTLKNVETPLRSPEAKGEHDFSARTVELVNRVARSESYGRLRSEGTPHADAFSKAAHYTSLQTEGDERLSSPDRALTAVIGSLGTAIEAKQEYDAIMNDGDPRYLGRDDKDRLRVLKESYLIPFNHTVKELVNTHPSENIRDVAANLARTHAAVFSKYSVLHPSRQKYREDMIQPKDAAYMLEAVINGMRHEVLAEALIEAVGYDFDHDVSIREDSHGTDGYTQAINEDGNKFFIASDTKASEAAQNQARIKHPTKVTVWTGAHNEDFMGPKGDKPGSLSVPYETIVRLAPLYKENLLKDYERRNNVLRSAGQARKAARVAINA